MLPELAVEFTFVNYKNGKEFTDEELLADSISNYNSEGITMKIVQTVISSYIGDGIVSSHGGYYKKCD